MQGFLLAKNEKYGVMEWINDGYWETVYRFHSNYFPNYIKSSSQLFLATVKFKEHCKE